jgi:hypothetical protein
MKNLHPYNRPLSAAEVTPSWRLGLGSVKGSSDCRFGAQRLEGGTCGGSLH